MDSIIFVTLKQLLTKMLFQPEFLWGQGNDNVIDLKRIWCVTFGGKKAPSYIEENVD